MCKTKFKPVGDSAILVTFGDAINPEIHAQVRGFHAKIEQAKIAGVVEIIPAYSDVLVVFNPLHIPFISLLAELKKIMEDMQRLTINLPKTLTIPVCYEGEFAPDMDFVCSHSNLTQHDVIKLHTAQKYPIYMMGFTPGFCYLGGMDSRISTPRKATPRLKIPAGAVGIAGSQTGIYPIKSPGGWQVIGQTPLQMFQPNHENPFPVNPGDFICFKSVTAQEFRAIEELIEKGTYTKEYE